MPIPMNMKTKMTRSTPDTAPATAAVLDADLAYLRDVPPMLRSAADASAAITQVKQKYPSYTGTGLLDFSTQNFFASCR
jgi:hypothetical protein